MAARHPQARKRLASSPTDSGAVANSCTNTTSARIPSATLKNVLAALTLLAMTVGAQRKPRLLVTRGTARGRAVRGGCVGGGGPAGQGEAPERRR